MKPAFTAGAITSTLWPVKGHHWQQTKWLHNNEKDQKALTVSSHANDSHDVNELQLLGNKAHPAKKSSTNRRDRTENLNRTLQKRRKQTLYIWLSPITRARAACCFTDDRTESLWSEVTRRWERINKTFPFLHENLTLGWPSISVSPGNLIKIESQLCY